MANERALPQGSRNFSIRNIWLFGRGRSDAPSTQNADVQDPTPELQIDREPKIPEDLVSISTQLTYHLREIFAAEGEKRKETVDFDVAPKPENYSLIKEILLNPPTIPEWKLIVSHLGTDIGLVERTSAPEDPTIAMQRDFLVQEVAAHRGFYEGKVGIKKPWKERLRIAQGVESTYIDDEIKLAQKEKVRSLFRDLGYSDLTKEEIERYRREHRISIQEFESIIVENAPIMFQRLSEALGREINPSFSIEIDNKNAYWFNWSDGNRDEFRLRINSHSRHTDKLTRGKAFAMLAHEGVGHFGQMAAWQEGIDEGKLLPVLGITSTHVPEQIECEGIAQTIHKFIPSIFSHLSKEDALAAEFAAELEGLRQMAYNDFHIAANEFVEGLDPNLAQDEKKTKTDRFLQNATTQFHGILESEPQDEIRHQFEERTQDPEKSVYLYSYGYGFVLHDEIARGLGGAGKKAFLSLVYTQPMTPNQEREMALMLVSGNQNYSENNN